jgi:hypothetical protein
MRMRNLLTETIAVLKRNYKTAQDVRFVDLGGYGWTTWEQFAYLAADINYNAGYGGTEINRKLCVVGDSWWLERDEHEGSEWWNFKTTPTKQGDAPQQPTNENMCSEWFFNPYNENGPNFKDE